MKKELNLKIIDSKEKAFLIGLSNCQALYYWRNSKEYLEKNILYLSFSVNSFPINYEILYNWFNKHFEKNIISMEYRLSSGHPWLEILISITEDSKDNLQCKYIPIKKSLYNYYIRGMFYYYSFENEIPFKNYVSNTIDIVGPILLLNTLSKKLNDYYNLTDFEIIYHQNPLKFGSLQYAKNEQNIKYFKNIWSCTKDLFNE